MDAKEIAVPTVAEPEKPDVDVALCCVPSDPTCYMRVNGKWHQVAAFQLDEKHIRTMSWPAVACHRCGEKLADVPVRKHKWGTSYLDENLLKITSGG